MANQNAKQDQNHFPALIAHTGTAGTAETVRIVADTSGAISTFGTVSAAPYGYPAFKTNDIDDGNTSPNVLYIGMTKDDATWLVKKFDKTSALITMEYATIANNPTVATYAAAWAAITTLTYGRYDQAF